MRLTSAAMLVVILLLDATNDSRAQETRITLDDVARAMGGASLKSIEYTGAGASFAIGQSTAPGQPWPRFDVKSYVRSVNYETASLREDAVRQRTDASPRGGGVPAMGEARQIFAVSGEHTWNVAGETITPAPVALAERQFQLWSTPHGVVKAAMAHGGSMQGRVIAYAIPGRALVKATVDAGNLVERVEAIIPNPVLGDIPVEVAYADYRDFGGVKFPMKIRQTAAGFPALDLVVAEVRPNAPADIAVPQAVRDSANPYARVTSQKVADGVWYLAGGTHHSVVIEMSDHLIVAESPLNDDRALAVIAQAKQLVPGKPIRYVINSHHHFDHAGGLRAMAAAGATVITHEKNRAFFEQALAAPATLAPDQMARAGRSAIVEGVRDRRALTDGTRTVEIAQIAGNLHADDLLMVYLPKEKLVIEADTYTPAAPNAPPASPVNPNSVNLADNIAKLGLTVDQILPLHGRVVPLADLMKAISRAP